jgi:hypothetical protein
VGELFADLLTGIFRELGDTNVRLDNYRMALQQSYVMMLAGKLVGSAPVRGLARAELNTIRGMASARIDTTEDWKVRAHQVDLVKTIDKAME